MIHRLALPIALVPASAAHAQDITQSSDNAVVDSKMCEIMMVKARFKPRLDERGKPVKFELNNRMVLNVTE